MNNVKLLAIGLALGLAIAGLFLIHDISINMRLNAQAPSEPSVNYIYDENNRLTSIVPVVLNPA